MNILEKEELIALLIFVVIVVALSMFGKLTAPCVDALKFAIGAFMGSKGLQGFLPGNKS